MRVFDLESELDLLVERELISDVNDVENIEKAFNLNIECLGSELIVTNDLKHVVLKTTVLTYLNCKLQWCDS